MTIAERINAPFSPAAAPSPAMKTAVGLAFIALIAWGAYAIAFRRA